MLDRLLELRGTNQSARAALDHPALIRHDTGSADGTRFGKPKTASAPRALVQHDRHHFRNDITCAPNHHGISFSHIEPLDLFRVVQRGVGYRDPSDKYGIKSCDRR